MAGVFTRRLGRGRIGLVGKEREPFVLVDGMLDEGAAFEDVSILGLDACEYTQGSAVVVVPDLRVSGSRCNGTTGRCRCATISLVGDKSKQKTPQPVGFLAERGQDSVHPSIMSGFPTRVQSVLVSATLHLGFLSARLRVQEGLDGSSAKRQGPAAKEGMWIMTSGGRHHALRSQATRAPGERLRALQLRPSARCLD